MSFGEESEGGLGNSWGLVSLRTWRNSWRKMERFEGTRCRRGERNRCLDCSRSLKTSEEVWEQTPSILGKDPLVLAAGPSFLSHPFVSPRSRLWQPWGLGVGRVVCPPWG